MAAADLAAALRVDPAVGLTSAEHARRLDEAGPNRLPTPRAPRAILRFLAQLSSPIVLTLIAGVLIATFVGARAPEGGVLVRQGHTEGSVDLMRIAGLQPAGVICEIMSENGAS